MKNIFTVVLLMITALLVGCNESNQKNSEKEEISTKKDSALIEKTPVPESSTVLNCNSVGSIFLSDDFTSVESKVGKQFIQLDSLFLEGTFQSIYTTLWKDETREMKIHWVEEKPPFKKIASIQINHPQSIYTLPNGIGIGSSLQQMVTVNNNIPVKFYGFGWDYGGRIMHFSDGPINQQWPCFSGMLKVADIDSRFMGDKEISSDTKGLPVNKIVLEEINITPMEKDR